ncbi:MAG: type II toxin-antitoxin system VapC family toxin [Verrucomicrobia bacterium]|nr:type II toxin-antitoxin system VapC family toxin [Verrucomicrobiota bacterium]
MRRFLDSSVLVESCLQQSQKFAKADASVSGSDAVTSAHALAEAYATLSGDSRLRISPADAARMVEDLADALQVRASTVTEYRKLIASAPAKGVRGGTIYDALHARTARLCGCQEIHTLNVAHFRHVAPDLTVVGL